MTLIRLRQLEKTYAKRDTTEEPYPVTIGLKDDEGATIEFRFSGMSVESVEDFRREVRSLLLQLDELVDEWEEFADQENDGFIFPPHENDGHGWFVKFEGEIVATGVPDRDVAMFLLAEAMTNAGSFPAVWETGRDWAPQEIGDEVRAFHDAGGTDLLPLEGVEYAAGQDVIFRDEDGDERSGQVKRDVGQHGVWVEDYNEQFLIDDRTNIRADTDDDEDS